MAGNSKLIDWNRCCCCCECCCCCCSCCCRCQRVEWAMQ